MQQQSANKCGENFMVHFPCKKTFPSFLSHLWKVSLVYDSRGEASSSLFDQAGPKHEHPGLLQFSSTCMEGILYIYIQTLLIYKIHGCCPYMLTPCDNLWVPSPRFGPKSHPPRWVNKFWPPAKKTKKNSPEIYKNSLFYIFSGIKKIRPPSAAGIFFFAPPF